MYILLLITQIFCGTVMFKDNLTGKYLLNTEGTAIVLTPDISNATYWNVEMAEKDLPDVRIFKQNEDGLMTLDNTLDIVTNNSNGSFEQLFKIVNTGPETFQLLTKNNKFVISDGSTIKETESDEIPPGFLLVLKNDDTNKFERIISGSTSKETTLNPPTINIKEVPFPILTLNQLASITGFDYSPKQEPIKERPTANPENVLELTKNPYFMADPYEWVSRNLPPEAQIKFTRYMNYLSDPPEYQTGVPNQKEKSKEEKNEPEFKNKEPNEFYRPECETCVGKECLELQCFEPKAEIDPSAVSEPSLAPALTQKIHSLSVEQALRLQMEKEERPGNSEEKRQAERRKLKMLYLKEKKIAARNKKFPLHKRHPQGPGDFLLHNAEKKLGKFPGVNDPDLHKIFDRSKKSEGEDESDTTDDNLERGVAISNYESVLDNMDERTEMCKKYANLQIEDESPDGLNLFTCPEYVLD